MNPLIGWLLYGVLIIYNVVDVYQTKLLFDEGLMEANPLLTFSMEITGSWLVIPVIKGVILTILGIGIFLHIQERKTNVPR